MKHRNLLLSLLLGIGLLLVAPASAQVQDPGTKKPKTPKEPKNSVLAVSDSPDLYEDGNLLATFTIRLNEPPEEGETVTVRYRTEAGTTSLFTPVNGTLTFTHDGPLQQTVQVQARADGDPPGGRRHDFEDFFLVIFDPTSAKIVRSRGRAIVYEQGIKPPGPDTGSSHIDPTLVPVAIFDALDRISASLGAGNFEYKRIGINDYLIFFTTADGKRFRVRFDKSGQVVSGPAQISERPAFEFPGVGDVKWETVPAAVFETLLKPDGVAKSRDFEYRRVGFDDFEILYTTPEGVRMRVRIDKSGDIVGGPEPVPADLLAAKKAAAGAAVAGPAAGPGSAVGAVPALPPVLPAGPVTATDRHLDPGKVDARVVDAVNRASNGQGPTKWEFLRFGLTEYEVFYTTHDGKRMRVRLDAEGRVIEGPAQVG